MKKIGQLTFHGAHNYGSVLQAYALSRQLQLMGQDPEIINLRPQSQKNSYQIIQGTGIHRMFHWLIYPALKRRHQEFERFITKVLPITQKEYSCTEELMQEKFSYDAYVCGGDQIWNPACPDFEPAYYLQFLEDSDPARKISYSPSLGKTEFDVETLENMRNWVRKFDAVSVRETRGAQLIQTMTEKLVTVVCDPVLLLEQEEWKKMAVPPRYKKPYILVYFLENNHGSKGLIDYLHKTLGYDVILLNEYVRDALKPYHHAYGASPEEFVGLFMNASFVYTNSFHGTVFATIFKKPFLTAIAPDQENAVNNNDSRKIDYLKKIGLEDRLYTTGQPGRDFLLNIDFETQETSERVFREQSLAYLRNALKE